MQSAQLVKGGLGAISCGSPLIIVMQNSETPNIETLFLREKGNAVSPRITVVIPLYNYRNFIAETLDSVAIQTLGDLDVIVVDDCSKDGGAEVACRWMTEHHGRFRKAAVLRNPMNAGLAATRNAGFSQSKTEFVFPLDADNLLYPSCLAKLHRSLAQSRAAFAYCIVERFAAAPDEVPPPFLMHLHPWRSETLFIGNKIDAMVLLRADVWRQVGGYSLTMPRQGWEDYDLWFKIARTGGYGLHVPQILARYRVHVHSMLHTVTNEKASIEVLKTYLRESYPEFYKQAQLTDVGRHKKRR